MKKIIGVIYPFDRNQTFYVYQDGNKIKVKQFTLDEIPTKVLTLAKEYDVEEIDLSGAKVFSQKLVQKIKEQELLRYNQNIINIKTI